MKNSLDASFINPVLSSVLRVLSSAAKLTPEPGRPTLKDNNIPISGKHITGLISMVGDKGIGSIAFTFSEAAIIHMANIMLPTEIKAIDGVVIDLAGELANMVLGGVKGLLEDKGYSFQLSLPTIIIGHEYFIYHRTNAPVIQLPFTMPEGDFFIEASFEVIAR